jgi:hypothetical protein
LHKSVLPRPLATNCYEEGVIKYGKRSTAANTLLIYYAATALFIVLDFAADFNVRLSFLEPYPEARIAYYAICFFCLALMIWRPAWTELIGAFESLVTLVALILTMGMRTLIVTDQMLDGSVDLVTLPEIINFLLAGGIAYIAWAKGIRRLQGKNGG